MQIIKPVVEIKSVVVRFYSECSLMCSIAVSISASHVYLSAQDLFPLSAIISLGKGGEVAIENIPDWVERIEVDPVNPEIKKGLYVKQSMDLELLELEE